MLAAALWPAAAVAIGRLVALPGRTAAAATMLVITWTTKKQIALPGFERLTLLGPSNCNCHLRLRPGLLHSWQPVALWLLPALEALRPSCAIAWAAAAAVAAPSPPA